MGLKACDFAGSAPVASRFDLRLPSGIPDSSSEADPPREATSRAASFGTQVHSGNAVCPDDEGAQDGDEPAEEFGHGHRRTRAPSSDVGPVDRSRPRGHAPRERPMAPYCPGTGDGIAMEILPRTVPASSLRIASGAWSSR